MIDPRTRALVAINEAISCLDYDSEPGLEADDLVGEAMSLLLEARGLYTSKPWPEIPPPSLLEFSTWFDERLVAQKKDGRA